MRTYDSREVRRRDALVEDVVEADVLKERMPLDLFSVTLARSEATIRVPR
jgi:hypothetical protein